MEVRSAGKAASMPTEQVCAVRHCSRLRFCSFTNVLSSILTHPFCDSF